MVKGGTRYSGRIDDAVQFGGHSVLGGDGFDDLTRAPCEFASTTVCLNNRRSQTYLVSTSTSTNTWVSPSADRVRGPSTSNETVGVCLLQ